jgi:hypothetical protein
MDCFFQEEEVVKTILNIKNGKGPILGLGAPCNFNHYSHSKFHPHMCIFDVVDCTNGSISSHWVYEKVARGRKVGEIS